MKRIEIQMLTNLALGKGNNMLFGQLIENESSYSLYFEREFYQSKEAVFDALTDPVIFSKWYPFATGEMGGQVGGLIKFDDGEGNLYQGVITKFSLADGFEFIEDSRDVMRMEVSETASGSKLHFYHTFSDLAWLVQTATGWHNCLNVFVQIMNGQPPQWPLPDELVALTQAYEEIFRK